MMTHPGTRPVVLNLSDDAAAGGCVFTGSGAQEECLWRRTGLCHTQTQKFYPLCTPSPSLSLLYSPQVPVLRESEANQYAWIQKPFPLDFIACPALKYPKVTPTQDLSDKDKQILEDRLRFILDVAIMKNNDSIVLGAMGCGAWKNPPKAVAKIFAKVLPEYRGYFRNIVVAILTTSNTRGPTLASIFQEAMTEEG